MKNLSLKALIGLLMLSLYACKDKAVTPVPIPVLKSFSLEFRRDANSSPRGSTNYTLEYKDGQLSNITKLDTIFEDKKIESIYKSSYLLTNQASNYKLTNITVRSSSGISPQTLTTDVSALLINNVYEVTTINSPNFSSVARIELNANNQIAKYTLVKYTVVNQDGTKRETLQNFYQRYEYDTKGNLVKVFQKSVDTAELLIGEYTYDDKPNPYISMKWLGRLFGTPGFESTNNALTAKSYVQGILVSEQTTTYTYDSITNYPLTMNSSGKSYEPNVSIGVSKTVFKYQ